MTTNTNIDMTHMVQRSKFHARHHGKYILEQRNTVTGQLEFGMRLPFNEATEYQIIQHYFNNVAEGASASQETIAAWYNNKGIFFRPKTW